MKIVLQRVEKASVTVDGNIVGAINKGYLVLLGVGKTDTTEVASKAVEKIAKLRIFADENGKTNLSSSDVWGEILVVSQFTLQANLSQNRPSFSNACPPDVAKNIYESFVSCCEGKFKKVQTGQFGAHMHVSVENDGPFTLSFEI